jgi:hypothetical protein
MTLPAEDLASILFFAWRRLRMQLCGLSFRQWVVLINPSFIPVITIDGTAFPSFFTALEKLSTYVFGAVLCSTVSIRGTRLAQMFL